MLYLGWLFLLSIAVLHVDGFPLLLQRHVYRDLPTLSVTLPDNRCHCRRSLSCGFDRSMKHRSIAPRAMLYFDRKDNNEQGGDESNIWAVVGLFAQPIVWASLANVKLTGAGLPSGPFGIVGALEGISYLILLAWSVAWGVTRFQNRRTVRLVEALSAGTIALGILVLLSLVADKGCVPNAKPILDYSNYLPVCEVDAGLFGG